MNFPIYRAKKINSDEYVEGYLVGREFIYPKLPSETFLDGGSYKLVCSGALKIDPSTLAIHFQDMIDSEGNKIFASLSKDGKGGSELEYESRKYVAYYLNFEIVMSNTTGYHDFTQNLDNEKCKVIGIQE